MRTEQEIRDGEDGILEKANPYNRPFSVMEKQNELAIELERVKQGRKSNNSDDDNGGGDNPSGDQPRDDGNNSPGRPPSTKDTSPRDERTPKTLSVLNAIATGLLDQVDQVIDTAYLKQHNTKNIRSLTKVQRTELERVKRGILSVLRPNDIVTKKLMAERLISADDVSCHMEDIFCELVTDFRASTEKEPTAKERRMLASLAWATLVDNK